MNKIVSASEFKAKCLKLIDEMQRDGQPVTITKRGKVVAELKPKEAASLRPLFGSMKGTVRWAPGVDPTEPADPEWEGHWDAKWDLLPKPPGDAA